MRVTEYLSSVIYKRSISNIYKVYDFILCDDLFVIRIPQFNLSIVLKT